MKYVDKRFIAYKERQSESEEAGQRYSSDRVSKRRRSREFHLFYLSEIKSLIDRIWWNNLKESDKADIMCSYFLNKDHIKDINKDMIWYNYQVFDTWTEWVDWVNKNHEPNKAGLRNDKLKELGIK